MGPGTHVIDKIMNNIKPVDYNDLVAQQHDIDYLTDEEPILSDIQAILNSRSGLNGVALRLGLTIRTVLDILLMPLGLHKYTHFNKSQTGNLAEDRKMQNYLYNKIDRSHLPFTFVNPNTN